VLRGPIVIGADGSERSRVAIEVAETIASNDEDSVVVVFVRYLPFWEASAVASGGHSVRILEEVLDARQVLAEAQSIALLGAQSLNWQFDVRAGDPATELMRAATEIGGNTIVVGGRAQTTAGRLIRSSVASRLLHRWPHNLVVAHPPGGRPRAALTSD